MNRYARCTVASLNPLKRFLHRQRFAASLRLLNLKPGQRLLDYGCGDGELCARVRSRFAQISITGFDPVEELFQFATERLADANVELLNAFQPERHRECFDRIACLETVEHLPALELNELLRNVRLSLKPDGLALFSFPIEHGVAAMFKNAARVFRRWDGPGNPRNYLRTILGRPVPRKTVSWFGRNYISSHVGFDCRAMIARLDRDFAVVKVRPLPLGCLRFGLGNSVAVAVKPRLGPEAADAAPFDFTRPSDTRLRYPLASPAAG